MGTGLFGARKGPESDLLEWLPVKWMVHAIPINPARERRLSSLETPSQDW